MTIPVLHSYVWNMNCPLNVKEQNKMKPLKPCILINYMKAILNTFKCIFTIRLPLYFTFSTNLKHCVFSDE